MKTTEAVVAALKLKKVLPSSCFLDATTCSTIPRSQGPHAKAGRLTNTWTIGLMAAAPQTEVGERLKQCLWLCPVEVAHVSDPSFIA